MNSEKPEARAEGMRFGDQKRGFPQLALRASKHGWFLQAGANAHYLKTGSDRTSLTLGNALHLDAAFPPASAWRLPAIVSPSVWENAQAYPITCENVCVAANLNASGCSSSASTSSESTSRGPGRLNR